MVTSGGFYSENLPTASGDAGHLLSDGNAMTTALCLTCGETKFGAFCPCSNCKAPATGNQGLDINFSDHRMSVSSLERLGAIIKSIRTKTDDDEVVFWTFISYMSSHPSEVLKADPPNQFASAISDVMANVSLPVVDLELKEMVDHGPPMTTVKAPPELFSAFDGKYEFVAIARVQVRDRCGTVSSAILMDTGDGPTIAVPDKSGIITNELVAIRKMPNRLLGWLIRPPWLP